MSETPGIPSTGAGPIRPAGPAGPAPTSTASGAPGVAFEALLERLSARASELEEKSRTLESPSELPEALDAARASLADALQLGSDLLEAYRAAQQTREPQP